jgi:LysR family hydrogen peroxide-inducible transcriptional activator
MGTITLRQIRYFQALARHRHFGKAASACAVTQPALSMQIRDLEGFFGSPLVERLHDGVRLTALGAEVARRGDDILVAVADLESCARQEPFAAPFRLGIIPSIAPYLLPRLLPALGAGHPGLDLVLRETITETLVEELASGGLEAVIASMPLDHPELDEIQVFEDPFLLAVPAGHPLARRKAATEAMLESDDLLLLEDGHCFRDQALAVCRRIPVGRLRSFGATSLSTLHQLVANGQGITLLPRLFVEAELRGDPRVALLRFAPPAPFRTIGVAWRRASSVGREVEALAAAMRADRAALPPPEAADISPAEALP